MRVQDGQKRNAIVVKVPHNANVSELIKETLTQTKVDTTVDRVNVRSENGTTEVSHLDKVADMLASGCGKRTNILLLEIPGPGDEGTL